MHLIRKPALALVCGLLVLASCKKDVTDNHASEADAADSTVSESQTNLIKDTVLDDAKDIYLWYKQIPTTFDARSYADPDAIMTAIRQYSIEPGFTDPVDRWSFAVKQQEWDNISSGIAGDFGLGVFFRNTTDLRVKSVEAASPAGKAGIHRGWRITKIDGNSAINTNNVDFVSGKVFNSTTATFTFEMPDGSTKNITLNAGAYQQNPVILDSVYTVGGKKIGYFAFNSFLGDTSQIYNAFNTIFSRFAAQHISDLIVDLRYNGGGYVSVQETLADYLAPLAADGNLMMKQQFNDKYTRYNSDDNFKKLGSLNLSRIYFIVSKNTASASELLINNLKPYVDVQLVGPTKTYGKPVGFFPIPVADWYIFPVSFRTTNKNGEGAYFNGMALNKQVADGLDKDWGDLQESCLADAVRSITGASLGQAAPSTFTEKPEVVSGNTVLSKPAFKGAVDTRRMH